MKLWLCSFVLAVATGCHSPSARGCDVDPVIFCAPFEEMAAEMPDSAKKELLALPKDEYWRLHRGLGMGIRNRFGLWQENELTQFFRQNGIDHPDSMSGPFIERYVLYLQRKPVLMTELLEAYRVPPPPPEPEQDTEERPNNSSKPTPLRGAA